MMKWRPAAMLTQDIMSTDPSLINLRRTIDFTDTKLGNTKLPSLRLDRTSALEML